MKSYSIDTNARKSIIVVLIFISFFLTKFINNSILTPLFNSFSVEFQELITNIEFWGFSVKSMTLFGVFAALYFVYVKWVWKIRFIAKAHGIPNLNGTWEGVLISNYLVDGEKVKVELSMNIKQDWNSIRIICTFPKSLSHNTAAFVYSNGDNGVELGFPYCNDANCADWTVKKHDGYNHFTVIGSKMIGRYFTNREDGTQGIITLSKLNKSS